MDEILNRLTKKFGKGKKVEYKKGGRAVIYIRVSTKKQEDGFSPETQREHCYGWAKNHDYEVVKCFEGNYESAKSDTKRKRFNEMLRYVKEKKNKIDAVIVYNMSRFSRTGSFSEIDTLKEHGIVVFSASSSYDARTISGECIQGFELLNARIDNKMKSQAIKDNGEKALRSGRWIQQVPRGYDMKTTKAKQEITVNEIGRQISRAFKFKANNNLTNEEVRVKMKAEGLDLRKQEWSKIFSNIFYAGYFSHNFLKGELIRGPHEALVSLDDFLKINGMLTQMHTSGYETKIDKGYAPLLGTIKCPICGGNLTASLSTKMKKKYGKDVGYYVCSHKGCKYNASTKKVNKRFEDIINGVSLNKTFEDLIKMQLQKAFPILNADRINEIKNIKANLSKIETQISTIEENYALATNEKTKRIYMNALEKKEKERDEILSQLTEKDNSILNLDNYINYGLNLKDNILRLWRLANLGDKKRIQNLIFLDGLVYSKENDDIEPLSRNEFIFLFDSNSSSYEDTNKKTSHQNGDLSLFVLEAGLEPAQP